jgi:hypothetical protein
MENRRRSAMLPESVRCVGVWLVLLFVPVVAEGQQLPDWTGKIRPDHPRLFFNAQIWPAVKQRALGAEHDWYRRVKSRIDGLLTKTQASGEPEPQDLGPEAAAAAFVFLMTEDQPGEPVARYWGSTVEGNHGGQHQQLGSVVKAFETNDDFVYVAGDATACYQHGAVGRVGQAELPQKCELATRQLVFLLPRHRVHRAQ